MEPFELPDDEWQEILTLIGVQINQRGLSGDVEGLLEVLKKDWGLFTNQRFRRRQLAHRDHRNLARSVAEIETQLQTARDRLATLPPDPGPPRPMPPTRIPQP